METNRERSPSADTPAQTSNRWRMLGPLTGAGLLVATLAPIPLWLLACFWLAASDPLSGDLYEGLWQIPEELPAASPLPSKSSDPPTPAPALVDSLSLSEQLVYLDPWLFTIYPLWAILGTGVSIAVALPAWLRSPETIPRRRCPTLGQTMLLLLLLLAWALLPFLVGLGLLWLTSTPDWSFPDTYS